MSRNRLIGSDGFSLIELLQVLVIFSIVLGIIFTLFIQVKKQIEGRDSKRRLEEQTASLAESVRSRIERSAGWIGGDSLGMKLVDRAGDTVELRWIEKDSVLLMGSDKRPSMPVRLYQAKFTYLSRPPALGEKVPDSDDADLDGNGVIEGDELRRARLVEIKLKTAALGRKNEISSTARLPEPIIEGGVQRP